MAWLFQPFPLAGLDSASTDVTVALGGSESASGIGSFGVTHTTALGGSASSSGAGSFYLAQTSGSEVALSAGSIIDAGHSVRLRSRKQAGIFSNTQALNGEGFTAYQQAAAPLIPRLLSGSFSATEQQAFPTKTVARLLSGQFSTTGKGFVSPSNSAGFIPSWVQLPTQAEEQAYYETNFGANSGKDVVWTWSAADKTGSGKGFGTAPLGSNLLPAGVTVHGDTEADDLWNHYMMYKRAGQTLNLNWAQAWRDYFCDPVDGYLDDIHDSGQPTVCEHYYGQGLVMWGIEQNDAEARATALLIAADMEPFIYGITPGVNNPAGRRYSRMLIVMNYICMMEPIQRWIDARDYLIELFLQNPSWLDSGNSNIVTGGNHFITRSDYVLFAAGGLGYDQYDAGYRMNHSFMYALQNEALWLSYKMTGRQDVRDMLIQMQRYILYYAWDPTHVNAMAGSRWGHRPDGTHWHDTFDEFSIPAGTGAGQLPNTAQPPPDVLWTDPTRAPADNYESSLVNGLVYAYKMTGEFPFLKRAREHLRQATCYTGSTGHATKLAQDDVQFFLDTQRDSSTIFFNYNKGMLQYASAVFENNGDPVVEADAPWTPPYPVPTADGQVIRIAGDNGGTTAGLSSTYGSDGSAWPTNCYTDVMDTLAGGSYSDTKNFVGCDTGSTFITSYGRAGAMVTAGGGGHHGGFNPGAFLFDFTDARWKRVWTTQGNPGVDNIAGVPLDGTQMGPDSPDRRTDTRIHNVPYYVATTDLLNYYTHSTNTAICNLGSAGSCWNPAHWTPTTAELQKCPLAADPRDQFWEVSLAYSSATAYTGANTVHNWPYPSTEWNGLQNGRFDKQGYITNNARFDPTPAGTLAPTQSELPATAHIWQNFHEMLPEHGGGNQGSIVVQRGLYAGESGVVSLPRSHRFDLETGIWHRYSTNDIGAGEGTATGGGESWDMEGQTASAYDSVMQRVYAVGQRISKTPGRINYLNSSDKTWRNVLVGSGGVNIASTGRTEALMVDPDRRLLLVCAENQTNGTSGIGPFFVIDLKTLTPDGIGAIPTTATGGWKQVPLTNVAGVTTHNGTATFLYPWRYYPPNGKYYRIMPRTTTTGTPGPSSPWPQPAITVLQRLTPPAIVDNATRAAYYYTSGANWVYDEITLNTPVPAPEAGSAYQSAGHNTFLHYVPSIQCFAWFPLDRGTLGGTQTRRSVFLIKPF